MRKLLTQNICTCRKSHQVFLKYELIVDRQFFNLFISNAILLVNWYGADYLQIIFSN